ncbi:import inner membrane translocase subunit tim54 [Hyphodiscus hymeniophilus]|uniref:Mitochondrial import inner membrane translocase subunit TIM54 n=1 Tax=Hyphodiscus hymeniophilus TaxID=353542 RepID=A0A9P6VKE2_9HELO|nr:import inner membrane translocase subunit tim54 [Hyphodiscus hymeniophilus]
MADTKPAGGPETTIPSANPEVKPDAKSSKPLKPPNPMWKYMGLGENFRPKLPSRNWTIFLTITGSFTAAVVYDKREKRRVQRKWAKLVEHIAKEPLGSKAMPRKLTVFLEGPPTDGLRVAQDHFKEYVKPVLVASGLDWDFIQGRKEGDVRAELAEKIRNSRLPLEQQAEDFTAGVRRKSGIVEYEGIKGDIVIGRHTWKEYVRGLHEGWLGPTTEPPRPKTESSVDDVAQEQEKKDAEAPLETLPGITIIHSTTKEGEAETPKTEPEPATDNEKPKKPPQPAPFIATSNYKNAHLPPGLPAEIPSMPISFPHILGFLNTPTRLYRFLNRRVLADQIGRETAAAILATYRPYESTSEPSSFTPDTDSDPASPQMSPASESTPAQTAEQQTVLSIEETEWHKNARKRVDGEPERTWLEPIVLDPRIAERMRRFELTPEDEARAKRIVVKEEEIEGWIKGGIRSLGRSGLKALGFGKEKKEATTGEEVLE